MLVKKVDPNWQPAENRALKVGETIEVTDAETLIKKGIVKAIGKNGEEISAYDLYGVVTKDEFEEFKQYQEVRKNEALKKVLAEEKAQLDAVKTETKPVETETMDAAAKARAEKVAKELAK